MAWITRLFRTGVLVNLAFAAAVYALLHVANMSYRVTLHDAQYFNGWALAIAIGVMLLLTVRKRLNLFPLGRVRRWLVMHYYLGYVTAGLFLLHAGLGLPDAPLEWILWGLFLLVVLSGVMGTILSKTIPARLESHGEHLLFERLPAFRARLAHDAEALALQSVRNGRTESIATLYADLLAHYFSRPLNHLAHLQSSRIPLTRILGELDSVERYLDQDGRDLLARMRDLVIAKDNLDFHHANAGLLKLWLFLHIPATYALIAAAILHVLLAYAFSSGVA